MKKLGLLILATLGLTGCGIDLNININHIPPVEVKNSTECKPEKENNPMAENKINPTLKDALAIRNSKAEEEQVKKLTEEYRNFFLNPDKFKDTDSYKIFSDFLENNPVFKHAYIGIKKRINPYIFWEILGVNFSGPSGESIIPKGRTNKNKYYPLPEIPEYLLPILMQPFYVDGHNTFNEIHSKAVQPVFQEFLEKQGYNVNDLAEIGKAYLNPDVSNHDIADMLRIVASQTPNQRLTQAMVDTIENKTDAINWDNSIKKNLPKYPESSLPPSYARPSRDKVPVAPARTLMEILTGKSPEKPKPIEPATVPVTTPVTTPTPVTADTLDTSFDNIEYDYDSPGGRTTYTPPIRYALTPEERDVLSTRIAEAMVRARQAEIDPTRTRKLGDLSYLRGY